MNLTFDHQKYNQFIHESKLTFVPNMNKFLQGVIEISRSNEWDGRIDDPRT